MHQTSMKWRSRQCYTWRSGQMCCQLSRWCCILHQCYMDQVSINEHWCHRSASNPAFLSCPVLVCPLLSNSHHCAPSDKSCFTKASDSVLFKLCKLFKFCPLSLTSHYYISPHIYLLSPCICGAFEISIDLNSTICISWKFLLNSLNLSCCCIFYKLRFYNQW